MTRQPPQGTSRVLGRGLSDLLREAVDDESQPMPSVAVSALDQVLDSNYILSPEERGILSRARHILAGLDD